MISLYKMITNVYKKTIYLLPKGVIIQINQRSSNFSELNDHRSFKSKYEPACQRDK